METLHIQGGFPLQGSVTVSGAKNSCLPIFAATLLTEEACIIENVPDLSDIRFMGEILQYLGAHVNKIAPNTWEIIAKNISHKAPYELVRKMRASVCLMGPLVGRCGGAEVSLPGGCAFGPRPIDLHLLGFKNLGMDVSLTNGYVNIKKTPNTYGRDIFLGGRHGSTVTGTANLIMAAVLTKGTTRIDSAACEPEVQDLCNFLVSMGANIQGIGSHILEIQGVEKLHGTRYKVIGDRIEAGTFIAAGLIPGNEILIKGVDPRHLGSFLHHLQEADIQLNFDNSILVKGHKNTLTAKEVITLPYPGYPTDLQAQLMTLLALTPGISILTERIYPSRFTHVPELERMGARISIEGASAIINGQDQLFGAPVMASDLRASASLVLAGLAAQGETWVQRIYHLDRGYAQFDQKLAHLGAKIQRVSSEDLPFELAS